MENIDDYEDVGLMSGIFIYNIVIHEKAIVWICSYSCMQPEYLGLQKHLFRVQYVQEEDIESCPNTEKDSLDPFHHGTEFIQWSLEQKIKDPLIQNLERSSSDTLKLKFTKNRILIGFEHAHVPNTQLPAKGAYLHIHLPKDYTLEDAKPSKEPWFKKQVENSGKADYEITLKAPEGIFSCSSGKSAAKKAKADTLGIMDIFKINDYTIHLRTSFVKVRLINVTFNYMWVNNSGLWSGCMMEFFRALYCKVYSIDFRGLLPKFLYLFQCALEEASPFNPIVPSFPFIQFKFGKPTKLPFSEIDHRIDYAIMAHLPCIRGSPLADFCLRIQPLDSCQQPIIWPLGIQELNGQLTDESESKIILMDPRYYIKINLMGVLTKLMWGNGCLEKNFNELLTINKLVTTSTQGKIKAIYNFVMTQLFKLMKTFQMEWIFLDKSEMMISMKVC
ncbi:putative subunit of helicase-primase complex [Saguinine gammaherpesvirus 1]|uniref:Subunit of helicase-primase complex n=1 Tax=Saguinine gammaherpesvirus 1 TaxID=2169901 RepID=A0A9Q8VIK7_9GAMA|nr:putative subunit of helicase-primase complex [Saguinine gammaherpesvirus 1]